MFFKFSNVNEAIKSKIYIGWNCLVLTTLHDVVGAYLNDVICPGFKVILTSFFPFYNHSLYDVKHF
jgi:hypothetical protein